MKINIQGGDRKISRQNLKGIRGGKYKKICSAKCIRERQVKTVESAG